MPAFKFPSPILYLASEPSFFSLLDGDNKNQNLKEVTRIDFPLIEKGVINKEHLTHALKSLKQASLHLVDSDEIFYHHISDYSLSAKKNIEEEIKETVSTVFADKKEPLHIVTVDLAKTSKMQTVQITAMTKANLSTLAEAAKDAEVSIESIIPASFVVKAFVSVDPSLFLLVTPQSYLLTSHYIGVDFAKNLDKEETKTLIDSIKTLKKERPHIQHIYICTDPTITTSLGQDLTEVLPIQDVEIKEIKSENDTPFFLKALTLGVKEVIENDFPLPHFSVQNAQPKEEKAEEKKSHKEKTTDILEKKTLEPITEVLIETKEDDKPKAQKTESELEKKDVKQEPENETEIASAEVVKYTETKATTDVTVVEKNEHIEAETITIPVPTLIATPKAVVPPSSTPEVTPTLTPPKVVVPPTVVEQKTIESSTKVVVSPSHSVNRTSKPTKKTNVFKYVLLALGVALFISLVGGGIVISQQAIADKKNPPLQTPVGSANPTEKPQEVTPTPKPTAAPVDLKKLNFLVLNATSVAGKAGKTAAALKKAGTKTVDAGNAKDEYDAGTFIMFATPELEGAKEVLEDATELSLDEKEMSKKENPIGKYDIVIVLNE